MDIIIFRLRKFDNFKFFIKIIFVYFWWDILFGVVGIVRKFIFESVFGNI